MSPIAKTRLARWLGIYCLIAAAGALLVRASWPGALVGVLAGTLLLGWARARG